MADVAMRLGTRELSAEEISDAVWLAARIAAADSPSSSAEAIAPPAPERVRPPSEAPRSPSSPPESARSRETTGKSRPDDSRDVVSLASQQRTVRSDRPELAATAFAVRDWPRPLGLPRELSKALRPLNRLAPSAWRQELDEENTAVTTAESGFWIPVHRPSYEHPFEVVLVIDTGSSMRIWERTAVAFRALLERQGAFTDVRTVRVNTDEKCIHSVDTAPGVACAPTQLVDPTGRRIIVVLSDGVGIAWRTGSMFGLMSMWARTSPVALVHLLPVDRWEWTGIRVEPRMLYRSAAGTSRPIPVLALQQRYLRQWADLISGTGGCRLPVLLPPSEEDFDAPGPDEVLTAGERLRRFRATSTPEAQQLAALLAAAPLTLPVIHAVHERCMPESGSWPLAEVMLGRLLRHVTVSPGRGRSVVEYEFAPGLRRGLLETITRDETAYVQRVVEDVLGSQEPAVANLRAVLRSPDKATLPVVTSRTAPLIAVQHEVLTAMSGPYASRATRLGEALDAFGKAANEAGLTPINGREPGEIGSAASDHQAGTIQPSRGISVTTTSEPRAEVPGPSRQTAVPGPSRQAAVWGGVPLRNVNFIGRGNLLESVHADLSKSTTTAVLPSALHGMGGIGKSQIAVEYVYRHADEYDLIWWIPSENSSEIESSLVKLAQRLRLPVEQSIDTAVPAVLDALGEGEPYRRWLLVFDNADRPELVRRYWPRRGAGHILVTSRNPQWAEVSRTVEVDVFKRAESHELLQRRNRDLSVHDADRLADVLGDLPLAVEQAAAWRAETGMSTDEYLRLFEDKRTELLESRPPADYPVAVEAAWDISLDHLREAYPGASELLEVCAFFSPEPISRALFSGVRNIPVSPALEETLGDPIQLGRALREITRYSLAKIDHRTDTISLHRLVQLVLRNKLSPDEQERVRHTAHLLLANRDPRKPDAVEYWPRYSELLPHIRAVGAQDCTDKWVRRMAINAVNYLFAFGDPAGGMDLARDFAQYWTEKLGEEHIDTLVISRWYGRTLRALGRFDEGRAVAERTLELMRATLGDTHEETLLTMHGVASDLRAKGDFEKAREMNEFAYRSAVDRFGEDDPDTLAAANNYALSLRLVGRLTEARELDKDTWERKNVVLGEDHRHTLLTLDNWSVDLRETGDYLLSRSTQEDTVRRMRQVLGDRHPMTLSAIKNLAIAYRKAGLHGGKKALALAIEATDGLIAKYGESHPDAMSAAMDLSIEHRQAGNMAEARRLGEHVKSLYETTWGPNHPFSVAAATNLAVTLRLQGAVDQARALNEKALADMREAVGEDHPSTLVCATNYASDLAASTMFEAAYSVDQDTLQRSVRVLGEDHPSTLALLVNQALDLRGLGRSDEADSMHLNAIQRLGRVLGEAHPATNAAQLNHRANCDIDPMQI